jgi:hypothetical protein
MKRVSTMVIGSAVLFLLPSVMRADGVTFDAGNPMSPAAGKVAATGSFTLDAGHTCLSVKMIVFIGGMQGKEIDTMVDQTNKTWGGMVSGLPTGTYTVVIRMVVTGMTNDAFSVTKTIDVQ